MQMHISDKELAFENIWNKMSKKSRQTIYQKVTNRGLEPTYEVCKEYWLGNIQPYKSPKSGNVVHIHIKDMKKRKRLDENSTRTMENNNRHKRRAYK